MKHSRPLKIGRVQKAALILAASSLPIATFKYHKPIAKLANRGLIMWGPVNHRGEQQFIATELGRRALRK